ncbi:dolichol kinase [Coemansia sp. RSA 552]|nr:dolichol kinase [Coemansia sp. RSA 552]
MDTARRVRLYYEAWIPASLLAIGAWHFGRDSEAGAAGWMPVAVAWALCAMHVYLSATQPATTQPEAEFRPQADDGAVWGGTLVPLVLVAQCAEASGPRAGLTQHGAWLLGLAMGWAATVQALGRHRGLRCCSMQGLLLAAGAGALALEQYLQKGGSGWLAWAAALAAAMGAQHLATWRLVRLLPRSFTLGEATVLSQGMVLVLVDLGARLLGPGGGIPLENDSSYPQMHTLFLEAVVLALTGLASSLAWAAARRPGVGPGVLAGLGLAWAALALVIVGGISRADPVRWAVGAAVGSRMHVLVAGYWVAVLGGALAWAWARQTKAQPIEASSPLQLHVRRKAFHILAAALFTPAFSWAPGLLHVGFTAALAGFVGVEAVRALRMGRSGAWVDRFMRRFTDARDAGPVVTAHFYLLGGCALPLWLGSRHAAPAGVLALGVADSAASLVGLRFGRRRWPASRKTVEGTLAFAASLGVSVAVLGSRTGSPAPLLFAAPAAALVEALTEQNDNAVVPLVMHAAAALVAAGASRPALFVVAPAAATMLWNVVEPWRTTQKAVETG